MPKYVSLDTLEAVNMKVSHCSLSEYAEICQSRYTGDSQYEQYAIQM